MSKKIANIFEEITKELEYADNKYKYDPMTSAEIGLATIKCELTELEREVIRPKRNEEWMRKEAIQTASMAVKFLRDICIS